MHAASLGGVSCKEGRPDSLPPNATTLLDRLDCPLGQARFNKELPRTQSEDSEVHVVARLAELLAARGELVVLHEDLSESVTALEVEVCHGYQDLRSHHAQS